MKYFVLTFLIFLTFANGYSANPPVNIPLGGNAYVTQESGGVEINKNGISNWNDKNAVISSWFKVSHGGNLELSIKAKTREGESEIELSVNGKKYPVSLSSSSWETLKVATLKVNENQHVRVDFKGKTRSGEVFADISDLIIEGDAAQEPLTFVREPENFYFGRRGPSVHLSYQIPESAGNVEYFYNEVTVPEKEDVIGSYYMVNGFGEGYCGIQVNSPEERRILFSVWSPFQTDNPDEIPEEAQVHMLGKGKDVITKEFGGEGSGGQSFLRYFWKAGNTYKFLTRVHPDKNREGATVYTAWFFDPEQNNWCLIASFSRPQKVTWYTRPHSFLENFIPTQGHLTRKVEFGNQWIVTEKGEWIELTDAKFTYDATASAKRRDDYYGGVSKNQKAFVLKNCGFFDENTTYLSLFNRKASTAGHPVIDFDALPNR
ncbi:DUF3472 domain-containing protein [Maribellus sp. YY47]|uniref:DUF3472 domain-containing protein n=1 Tax=Maribellus sp. YY47 TaxID=2929486 RepID=UPI002001394C|nr:DUF3472 domain-containing protein [Maribellus sp. YY47]MCK3685494.1 DUF3472 domain-containing protein [Maribellus sp. YY47]